MQTLWTQDSSDPRQFRPRPFDSSALTGCNTCTQALQQPRWNLVERTWLWRCSVQISLKIIDLIILAVDRRSRVSTSIFTSGRSHQYLWSNNCISHSFLFCYIARRTLFIIAPYWINCMCLSVQKRAEYAYKVTASNCLSTDCKHVAYGRPLLIVFNGCVVCVLRIS